MSLGLVGRKVGMTRFFSDDGESVPVTVLDVSDNRIAQLKTVAVDGYSAVQLVYGARRASRISKPVSGHLAKAGIESAVFFREFRAAPEVLSGLKVGDAVLASTFSAGQKVDVAGFSIGKGFQGGIKRHNFSSNRASHGNSVSHNAPGSIGMAQDPGRVFPGKKMAGHLGASKVTVQGLLVVGVDVERRLLLVKGSVPGSRGGCVLVSPALKG